MRNRCVQSETRRSFVPGGWTEHLVTHGFHGKFFSRRVYAQTKFPSLAEALHPFRGGTRRHHPPVLIAEQMSAVMSAGVAKPHAGLVQFLSQRSAVQSSGVSASLVQSAAPVCHFTASALAPSAICNKSSRERSQIPVFQLFLNVWQHGQAEFLEFLRQVLQSHCLVGTSL